MAVEGLSPRWIDDCFRRRLAAKDRTRDARSRAVRARDVCEQADNEHDRIESELASEINDLRATGKIADCPRDRWIEIGEIACLQQTVRLIPADSVGENVEEWVAPSWAILGCSARIPFRSENAPLLYDIVATPGLIRQLSVDKRRHPNSFLNSTGAPSRSPDW